MQTHWASFYKVNQSFPAHLPEEVWECVCVCAFVHTNVYYTKIHKNKKSPKFDKIIWIQGPFSTFFQSFQPQSFHSQQLFSHLTCSVQLKPPYNLQLAALARDVEQNERKQFILQQ